MPSWPCCAVVEAAEEEHCPSARTQRHPRHALNEQARLPSLSEWSSLMADDTSLTPEICTPVRTVPRPSHTGSTLTAGSDIPMQVLDTRPASLPGTDAVTLRCSTDPA